jgi:hypothetical protein
MCYLKSWPKSAGEMVHGIGQNAVLKYILYNLFDSTFILSSPSPVGLPEPKCMAEELLLG